MVKMIFRNCESGDAVCINNLLKQTWHDAYSSFIPKTDLDFYLEKTYSPNLLQQLFINKDYKCIVTVVDEKIAGWLKLYNCKNENRFYLSSIYVLPNYQKMKIGEMFFNLSCEEALKNNYNEIFIGVMKQNERALSWYKKLGFIFFEELPFTMGNTSVPHLIGKKILEK